jgi:hypothetical protein
MTYRVLYILKTHCVSITKTKCLIIFRKTNVYCENYTKPFHTIYKKNEEFILTGGIYSHQWTLKAVC